MRAQDVLWQLADEQAIAPATGAAIPERAAAYLDAWMRTVDHGCGHAAPVIIAPPFDSVMCVDCARALHLDQRLQRCAECRSPVGDDGLRAIYAARDLIIFAALCGEHTHEGTKP